MHIVWFSLICQFHGKKLLKHVNIFVFLEIGFFLFYSLIYPIFKLNRPEFMLITNENENIDSVGRKYIFLYPVNLEEITEAHK